MFCVFVIKCQIISISTWIIRESFCFSFIVALLNAHPFNSICFRHHDFCIDELYVHYLLHISAVWPYIQLEIQHSMTLRYNMYIIIIIIIIIIIYLNCKWVFTRWQWYNKTLRQ
jgi:hypothetical protein